MFSRPLAVMSLLVSASVALGQEPAVTATATRAPLPPLPAPLSIPQPGPTNVAPYAPQAILPGGIVIPLYPPGSPFLKADRVREAEQYHLSKAVPGRINSIVNIHNPSIEVHPVDGGINTGTVIILAAGGGHNTLNVGTEAADLMGNNGVGNNGVASILLTFDSHALHQAPRAY